MYHTTYVVIWIFSKNTPFPPTSLLVWVLDLKTVFFRWNIRVAVEQMFSSRFVQRTKMKYRCNLVFRTLFWYTSSKKYGRHLTNILILIYLIRCKAWIIFVFMAMHLKLLVGVRLLIIFQNNKTIHLFKIKAQEALSQSLNNLISSKVSILSLISSS